MSDERPGDDSRELPTAYVVKKADRKVPGRPSASRVEHVRERLVGSRFARRDECSEMPTATLAGPATLNPASPPSPERLRRIHERTMNDPVWRQND